MKYKSMVTQGFSLAKEFAAASLRSPIKTARNIAAAIATTPQFMAQNIPPGIVAAGGLFALGVGAYNLDPVLGTIGLTFASVGLGALNERGAAYRTEEHAATLAARNGSSDGEPDAEPSAPPAEAVQEKTLDEKLDSVLGTGEKSAGGFKPNLERFKKPAGPESSVTGGP